MMVDKIIMIMLAFFSLLFVFLNSFLICMFMFMVMVMCMFMFMFIFMFISLPRSHMEINLYS